MAKAIAVGGKLIGTAHWRAGRKTALLHQHAMKVDQTLSVGMMASTRASPGGGPGGPVAISAIAVARLLCCSWSGLLEYAHKLCSQAAAPDG